ncbi:MAG: A/G-specific adenine glycosylase [Patiriisocius sp.]
MKKKTSLILDWYHDNQRILPWRENTEPYFVWLSEIILQQTRVEQGKPYYIKFLQSFPTVHDLANAPEKDIMKLWQGLGYYSRAKNLHKTAKIISQKFKGVFPNQLKQLKSLPGIGDYTAAAIASIAFNQPTPVLDGNVYRVISRIFNIDLEIGSTVTRNLFLKHAQDLMGEYNPGDFNQAMMEFGALQCIPRNPDCENCPIIHDCMGLQEKNIQNLPNIRKKKPLKNRYMNYFLIHDTHQTIIQKRTEKDIWNSLYELPLIDSFQPIVSKEMIYSDAAVALEMTHLLTHQRIHLKFYNICVKKLPAEVNNQIYISLKDLHTVPVPKPIEKFFQEFKLL